MTSNDQLPIIEIKGLTKKFRHWLDRPHSLKSVLINLTQGKLQFGNTRRFTVLEDLDLNIYPGDFIGIMGRNGAGKSTLFKLISGIYHPTHGTIVTRGVIAPMIELGAGFHPELTGHENIFLNASILGFGKKATEAALKDIIDFSELGDKIEMPVKNYSSGMLMRLGFSIATHLTTPILLIDEILGVGDSGFQQKCIKRIQKLHKEENRTIVLITHDPNAVKYLCNRCVVIDGTKKVFDGNADEGTQIYLNAVSS